MNKHILLVALMVFQSWTLAWGASYQLLLNNGNEIKTSRYWEEGNEIRFYQYGGVVGVPRANVIGIKSSNSPLQEDKDIIPSDTIVKEPKIGDNTKNQTNEKEEKKIQEREQTGVIDPSYYKSQKAALKDNLDDALERNREATRRKDQEAKDATRLEMREYVKKIYDLEAELKEKNKGVLPNWWNE